MNGYLANEDDEDEEFVCPSCSNKTIKGINKISVKYSRCCGFRICITCSLGFRNKCGTCEQLKRQNDWIDVPIGSQKVSIGIEYRKDIKKYKKNRSDFASLKDYNDYLEELTDLEMKSMFGDDQERNDAKRQIEEFKSANKKEALRKEEERERISQEQARQENQERTRQEYNAGLSNLSAPNGISSSCVPLTFGGGYIPPPTSSFIPSSTSSSNISFHKSMISKSEISFNKSPEYIQQLRREGWTKERKEQAKIEFESVVDKIVQVISDRATFPTLTMFTNNQERSDLARKLVGGGFTFDLYSSRCLEEASNDFSMLYNTLMSTSD
jgi:hypothetical protein